MMVFQSQRIESWDSKQNFVPKLHITHMTSWKDQAWSGKGKSNFSEKSHRHHSALNQG